jgi:hypothetical protein
LLLCFKRTALAAENVSSKLVHGRGERSKKRKRQIVGRIFWEDFYFNVGGGRQEKWEKGVDATGIDAAAHNTHLKVSGLLCRRALF